MEMNWEGLAMDAWLDAVPEDAYDLCPCGCGKKWRYVVKGGEEEIAHHAQRFLQNWIDSHKDKVHNDFKG